MRRDAERKAKIFRSETPEQNESAENREPSEMPETVSAEGGQEIEAETGAKSGEMTAAAAESEPSIRIRNRGNSENVPDFRRKVRDGSDR